MNDPKSSKAKAPPVPAAADNRASITSKTSGITLQRTQAMTAIRDTYQKNFEMMTRVTQALTNGAASVFQRQQDVLRNAMTQASVAAHERISTVAPQKCPEAIGRYKQAVDAGLANVRSIAELAEQSKREAFNLAQQGISERLQELTQQLNVKIEPSPTRPAGTSPAEHKRKR